MLPLTVALPETELSDTAFFFVHAAAEPGVLPRMLELFAKRGLIPSSFHGSVSGPDQDRLTFEIRVRGLARDTADYIGACLRQLPYVEVVLTSEQQKPHFR